jgi:hypothetical protein
MAGAVISVEFHPLAAREFRQSRIWYEQRQRSAALNFVAAVDAAADRIASDPEAHPIVSGPYRWVRVRRFPFRLIFR